MKIGKKQFKKDEHSTSMPEAFLEKVVYPFIPQITSRNIKVYFCRSNNFDLNLKADWEKYQLVFFNILQNAVKYNEFMGDILVVLTCLPSKSSNPNELILETEIIDTGLGISSERQKMLFVPFLELKVK